MAQMYYDQDGNLDVLKEKTITVIGYGIQGRGQALNLRDSGMNVVIGCRQGRSWAQAEEDGMTVKETPEAVAEGDVMVFLVQDHLQADVYRQQVEPHLDEGNALIFSHGFNIHFNQIIPPDNIDVLMIAPKGPGSLVREMYVQEKGVPALLAIHQDFTGAAKQVGLAYAKAIRCLSAGVIETTFKEETETDLFGEQTVLCGGVSELIRAGFDTLVAAGYQPEIAYFEVVHELKLIVDMINDGGIIGMRKRVSDTAKYGDMTRGRRVVSNASREAMAEILDEIQSGEFAKEWLLENMTGRCKFNALMNRDANHTLEVVGRELRAMMPWMEAYEG